MFLVVYCVVSIATNKAKEVLQINEFKPLVSVIIVVRNEEEVIKETVDNLLRLEYDSDKLELIIIDDCSSDSTLSILKSYSDKIIVRSRSSEDKRGKPAAINDIMDELKSDLVCVLDADSIPEQDFIKKAVEYFKDERVGLVQCRNVQYNSNRTFISSLVSFEIDNLHLTVYRPKQRLGFPLFEGRGALIRRSVFISLGGFDITLPTEDWDFGFRVQIAGNKLIYDSNICNYEQATETVIEYLNQRYRWLGTILPTFTKNIGFILRNKKIPLSKKIDSLFIGFFALWALIFNLLGLLGFINLIGNHGAETSFFIYVFFLMVFFGSLPTIVHYRKLRYLLLFPFMYLYYWSFSIILPITTMDRLSMKGKITYKKANHFSKSVLIHRSQYFI